MAFICDICSRSFNKKHHLARHIKNIHDGIEIEIVKCVPCNRNCGKWFSHKRTMKIHSRDAHGDGKSLPASKRTRLKQVKEPKKSIPIEEFPLLMEHLPPDRDYIVHNFEARGEDFRAEFSFQILNEADGEAFVKDYFCHAKVKFIVRNKKRQNERSENVKVITKTNYCCHHNSQKKNESNRKDFSCPATMQVTVVRNGDKLLCVVLLNSEHNHISDDTAALKLQTPDAKLKKKSIQISQNKLSPNQFVTKLENDLIVQCEEIELAEVETLNEIVEGNVLWEQEDEKWISDFQAVLGDQIQQVKNDPSSFKDSVQIYIKQYWKLKTRESLISAFRSFGKYNGLSRTSKKCTGLSKSGVQSKTRKSACKILRCVQSDSPKKYSLLKMVPYKLENNVVLAIKSQNVSPEILFQDNNEVVKVVGK